MPKVLIVYFSRTVNTEKMAQSVAEGAKEIGITVELKKAELVNVEDLIAADGVAFGSATSWSEMGGRLKDVFENMLVKARDKFSGKPFVAFTSAGGIEGGKKAVDRIQYIAKYLKMQPVMEGVVSISAPGDKEKEACRELGRKLAQAIKR
jgi:flavorubredoxin